MAESVLQKTVATATEGPALLALEDGTVFTGHAFGSVDDGLGEIVFNTALTGYQEVLTDPSYRGQIVLMTAPQIGNVGVNPDDFESKRPWCSGLAGGARAIPAVSMSCLVTSSAGTPRRCASAAPMRTTVLTLVCSMANSML